MRYLMGCFVEIEVSADSDSLAHEAIEAAFAEIKRIEALLSKFSPHSVVSKINDQAAQKPVVIPAEVFDLLKSSLYYSEITNGAFDITVEPLTELWRQAERDDSVPSQGSIQKVLNHVGMRHLRLDASQTTIQLTCPEVKIDLGGLGKGYAIERAVRVLKNWGVSDAVVNAGSTIYALGDFKTFGITNPTEPLEMISSVSLKNECVSTSANYERFFSIRGKRFGHLIHPHTGAPVESRLLSTSVVASSAMASDIYSTAVMILGETEGKRLIRRLEGIKLVLITRSRFLRSLDFTEICSSS